MPGRRAPGVLRRNPDFARVYLAQLVSYAGDWFATVALLGLVLDTTGRRAPAAIILAAQLLPMALTSPFAGVVVDRLDRKQLMIAADLARAGLATAYLLARSDDTIWIAFACTIGISSLSAFFEPAASAALPNLVKPEDLATANVLIGSAWGTMLAVGAALGGVVTAAFGRDVAFIADAASFLVSAALLVGVRGRFRTGDAPARGVTVAEDIREAVRYARADRRVLSLLAVKGGFGLAGGAMGLLSIMAVDVFGAGDAGIGLLMSARGLGALVGPFVFRRMFGTRGRRLFVAIGIAFACYGVGYGGVGASPTIALAALAAFLAHLGGGAQWTLSTYALQRFTDDRVRGRIFSFDYGLVTLTLALSITVSGIGADHVNPRIAVAAFAAVAFAWAAIWTAATTRVRRSAGDEAGGEPAPAGGADQPTESIP